MTPMISSVWKWELNSDFSRSLYVYKRISSIVRTDATVSWLNAICILYFGDHLYFIAKTNKHMLKMLMIDVVMFFQSCGKKYHLKIIKSLLCLNLWPHTTYQRWSQDFKIFCLTLMERGSWMLLEEEGLNQSAPSRSPRITLENKVILIFRKFIMN